MPSARGEARDPTPVSLVRSPAPKREALLLVDDEALVRRVVPRILEREGFVVRTAENGSEALSYLESHECKVRLMLTDIVMPSMSGPELAAVVSLRYPEIRVLFMSGYAVETGTGRARELAHPLLEKPFRSVELIAAVKEALGHGEGLGADLESAQEPSLELLATPAEP